MGTAERRHQGGAGTIELSHFPEQDVEGEVWRGLWVDRTAPPRPPTAAAASRQGDLFPPSATAAGDGSLVAEATAGDGAAAAPALGLAHAAAGLAVAAEEMEVMAAAEEEDEEVAAA